LVSAADVPHDRPHPSVKELFLGFFGISVVGFGGVIPWARWMLVERRRWLTPVEFNEIMALAQTLPGGNILNMAVILGHRYHGFAGALAGVLGLILGPFGIVILMAMFFERFQDLPGIQGALHGISAAAIGLIVALAVKMILTLKGEWIGLGFAAAAFVCVGVLRLPLLPTLGVLAPLSVAYAWFRLVRAAL
jgi:chromate transporter